ncbi:hypothetical protein LIER_02356 [Lithospermum erythrorhizon]|uniref:Uncharacterized protein n=1 Tax=Lithospermum erythrorhizon TaxID=34254 RepID=A0AAV3NQ85_LITER
MFIKFKNEVKNQLDRKIKRIRFMSVSDRTISEARDAEFFEHIFPLNKGVTNPHIVPNVLDESCDTNRHASCSNFQVDEPRKRKRARVEKTFGDEFITNFLSKINSLDLLSDELILAYIIEKDPKIYNEALKSIDANF